MANNPYLYPMKYLLFYIISLLSLTACIREDLPAGSFALEKGDLLPEFSISNPDGTVSNKDLENKFALIIFFSTTCSDCQKAFPDISTLYHTYKDDPSVCVLLIARGETEEQHADRNPGTSVRYEVFRRSGPERLLHLCRQHHTPRIPCRQGRYDYPDANGKSRCGITDIGRSRTPPLQA